VATGLVLDVLQPCCGKVGEESLSMVGWLPTNLLWDVPNRDINGVCRLVSKQCQLCFVCRYDDGDDCGTRVVLFKLCLQSRLYL